MRKLRVLLPLLFTPSALLAQAIDNAPAYKSINQDSYIRFNYENDFFSGTDLYYTQGMNLEVVTPLLRRSSLHKLLLLPHYGDRKFGIAAEHDGYTPRSYSNPAILYGDRPYAGCLFLKCFITATDTVHRQRWTTTLSTGVIGQAAGGMEMQTAIHRWLHDVTPRGWPNQVHNDAILNYQVDYDRQLFAWNRIFMLNAGTMARAGTLSDIASAGISIMAGYFDNPYRHTAGARNSFRVYAYEHPEVNLVGYDATLQGGVFNHTSPYVVAARDINRITYQNRFGLVVIYRGWYLEYFQSLLSREFHTADFHVWGGIQIASKI